MRRHPATRILPATNTGLRPAAPYYGNLTTAPFLGYFTFIVASQHPRTSRVRTTPAPQELFRMSVQRHLLSGAVALALDPAAFA